jgi:hypothetical protein
MHVLMCRHCLAEFRDPNAMQVALANWKLPGPRDYMRMQCSCGSRDFWIVDTTAPPKEIGTKFNV